MATRIEGRPGLQISLQNYKSVGEVEPNRMWGTCIETNKGPIFEPYIVKSVNETYKTFGVDVTPFLDAGGKGLTLIRVTSGITAPSNLTIKDTGGADILKLTAKFDGTSKILIGTISYIGEGYNCRISSEGYSAEYYDGINSIKNLEKSINDKSKIVTAEFIAEPTAGETIETNNDVEMTGGSNGDGDPITGELSEEKAGLAHRKGLKLFEDQRIAGVFSTHKFYSVQDEYYRHALLMNTPEVSKFRFAILGAINTESKDAILERAALYDDERVLFVGQGVKRGSQEFLPREATIYVAGKSSALEYNESLYGGQDKKIIQGLTDVLEMTTDGIITTDADRDEYNEYGVITFKKEYGDISLTEGVTTVQPTNETGIREESVVRIVNTIAHRTYDTLYPFIGTNITPELETVMKRQVEQMLSNAEKEGSLISINDEENGAKNPAYTVDIQILPRENQRLGKVSADITILPVYSLRQIAATINVM